MESTRIRSYRSFKVDEHMLAVAVERYRTVKACQRLRDSGCDEAGRWSISPLAAARCIGGRPRVPTTSHDDLRFSATVCT